MQEVKRLSDNETRRVFWAALFFVLFMLSFETYVLNPGFTDFFVSALNNSSLTDLSISIGIIIINLALLLVFVIFALSSNWFYKAFCFALFAVAAAMEYGYQKALNRFSDIFDIANAIGTNSDQKKETIFLFLNAYALIPCAVFLLLLILVNKRTNRQNWRNFLAFLMIASITNIAVIYYNLYYNAQKIPSLSINSFARTTTAFAFASLTPDDLVNLPMRNNRPRDDVKKPQLPEDFRPANNIIYVLDESVRGDHLSINGYERPTTPFLEELEKRGNLYNWGIAAASATSSRFSYNALLTGAQPDDFPDMTHQNEHRPTFFQYAKSMNYTTYYFDGQMKEYWGSKSIDGKFVDHFVGVDQITDSQKMKDWETDEEIARRIKKIVSESTGNFIFIFKRGNHYPYQNNFPSEATIWQPSNSPQTPMPTIDQSAEVTNSYDNSIKYNVDGFFKTLIGDDSNFFQRATIIYTGDHGETLFQTKGASHGGTTKAEATVPLFVIGNLPSVPDLKYKASHHNIFPTILDLMSFPDDFRERNYSSSLLRVRQTDSRQRFYNPNHGVKFAFD